MEFFGWAFLWIMGGAIAAGLTPRADWKESAVIIVIAPIALPIRLGFLIAGIVMAIVSADSKEGDGSDE